MLNRIINLSKYLPGLPSAVYENFSWFWFVSNALEMDRIKANNQERHQNALNAGKPPPRIRRG